MLGILLLQSFRPYHKEISAPIAFENFNLQVT